MGNVPIYPKSVSVESLSPTSKIGDRKLDRDKLKKSCGDFEAILIQQLMKSMRQTMTPSGFTGGGLGKDMYTSLFDQELSQSLAKRGGLGLGKMIYDRVIRREEKNSPVPPEIDRTRLDGTDRGIPSARERGGFHGFFGR